MLQTHRFLITSLIAGFSALSPLCSSDKHGLSFEMATSPETQASYAFERILLRYADPQLTPLPLSALQKLVSSEAGVYGDSEIIEICQKLVKHFNDQGYIGVSVSVDPKEIDAHGRDLRQDQSTLTLVISPSYVANVHTRLKTKNGESKNLVDASRYTYLKKNFPLGFGEEKPALNSKVIEDYLARANRNPARSISAELTDMAPDGGVDVDIIINEDRPWHAYANVSNTGVEVNNEERSRWIERFGYVDYQLTGKNDVLSLELITATFDHLYAAGGYYELPVFKTDRFRFRAEGAYSTFDLQALELQSQMFSSTTWRGGPFLVGTIYQCGSLFIDVSLGTRWTFMKVRNDFLGTYSKERFFIPMATFSLESRRMTSNIGVSFSAQKSIPRVANTNTDQAVINGLGRTNAQVNWWLLEFGYYASFYLFPWESKTCKPNLVHELVFITNGQYAFDYRLIPQVEGVLGGLYSVRGYSQSIAAGDTIVFSQMEYRYHLRFMSDCNPCKKNWELVFKAFGDAGKTFSNKRTPGEVNTGLVGAGVGLELFIRKNFIIRGEYGVALKHVPYLGIEVGSGRGYMSASLIY